MSNEVTFGADPDQTTGRIYDIIHTMEENGRNGSDADSSRTRFTSPAGEDPEDAEKPNADIEKQLFAQGILHRPGPVQRRLLGCIACKFKNNLNGNGPNEIRASEIAFCSETSGDPALKFLKSLRDAGLLHAVIKRRTDLRINAPTEWFSLTDDARASGLMDALTVPEKCGLAGEPRPRPRQPVRPRPPIGKLTNDRINQDAEQFLISEGIFRAPSRTRRAALGCLACQLQRGHGTFGLQVARCQDITHTTAGNVFSDLERKGIATSSYDEGRRRVLYQLSPDSPLGARLGALLETPQQCGLERTIEPEAKT